MRHYFGYLFLHLLHYVTFSSASVFVDRGAPQYLGSRDPSGTDFGHLEPRQGEFDPCLPSRLLLRDDTGTNVSTVRPRQNGAKVALRIMPLGASITAGEGSTPQNGYRKPLRDKLRFLGHEVNMIGSHRNGDFNDNDHEGVGGAMVAAIKAQAAQSISQKPNVVLINCGSNDSNEANDKANPGFVGPARKAMKETIDYLIQQSPGVTVILSTLLQSGTAPVNRYVNLLNGEYRSLVDEFRDQGHRVQLAEMNNGFITTADLKPGDPTHPGNEGYRKMAAVWANAIARIESSIVTPIDTGIPDKGAAICEPSADKWHGPTMTQRGSGVEDGTYLHKEVPQGLLVRDIVLLKGVDSIKTNYHFAQLVNGGGADRGGETDDLIRVLDPGQRGVGSAVYPPVAVAVNGRFDKGWVEIDTKIPCLNRGVRWGDFNNDGLDDFICLSYPEGHMNVAINRGGDPPTFEDIGRVRDSQGWITQAAIRLGDIDGDGRLDYCAVRDNGDVWCWRNGGQGDNVDYWEEMAGNGPTFNTKGMPDTAGVRLVDINGDFRADWVYVFPDGATKIWINQRGTAADGPGLKPAWIEAAATHGPGAGLTRDTVRLARIYGSGRADYVTLVEEILDSGFEDVKLHRHNISVNRNEGTGGKNLRGDGVHYCDMYGRGHDDYVWVYSDGNFIVYENINNPPFWSPHENVLYIHHPRKGIHLADWDGDGLCDVLAVDKATGRTRMWRNTYKSGDVPTFAAPVEVAGGLCNQGWGVGQYDLGVRFADIDGDKRADYLCLEKDGRTTGWLNKPGGLQNVQRIKGTQGLDRANHRYVDVNGDGRADFLWQNKVTGDVIAWINNGMIPSSGSSFNWARRDNFWKKGMDRGANLFFAKMSNSGKLDYVQNLPKTNVAYTWYNDCPRNGGSLDDGPITDPNLPTAPPADGSPIEIGCPLRYQQPFR